MHLADLKPWSSFHMVHKTVHSTDPPPVYLSLSSTNYLSGLSEIPLSSVGEGRGSSLVCHTDLASCCRQLDSGVEGGLGEWHYPDGSVVGSSREGADGLYVSRDQMSISLNYRGDGTSVPDGVYCCVVPTTVGVLHYCVKISKFELII